MAFAHRASPIHELLSTRSRTRRQHMSTISTSFSAISTQKAIFAFSRASRPTLCTTFFPLWVGLWIMLPAETALPIKEEPHTQPNIKAHTRSDTLTFIARGLRGVGKSQFPYSHASLTAAVTPHNTSSDSNEKDSSQLSAAPALIRENSLLSTKSKATQYTDDDDNALQEELMRLAALENQEESAFDQSLEGSFSKSDDLNLYGEPSALGPDIFLRPQDAFSTDSAFLELKFPELREFRDFEDVDPMSDIHDAGEEGDDEGDETYWSGNNGYPLDEEEDEETSFLIPAEQRNSKGAHHSEKHSFFEAKYEGKHPIRKSHIIKEHEALPIEYTIAKYKSADKSLEGHAQPVRVALAQDGSKIDTNAIVRDTPPFISEKGVSKAQGSSISPVSKLPTPPAAEKKIEKGSFLSVTALEAKADDEDGASLEGRLGGGEGDTKDIRGSGETAGPLLADSEFPENADELDVSEDEEEMPLRGERRAVVARRNGQAEEEEEEEEISPGSKSPDLHGKAPVPSIEESKNFKTPTTAEAAPELTVRPKTQSSEAGGEVGVPLVKESEAFSAGTPPFEPVVHAQIKKQTFREGRQVEPPRPRPSEAVQPQPQQKETITALLEPPSFIDWQTLGAVMTDPALRASGSPFLVPPPTYYTGTPEPTSHQGRIMVVLFASMIVLLIILLFCCCMVRRKRAHEAYMAAPMIIQ